MLAKLANDLIATKEYQDKRKEKKKAHKILIELRFLQD